LFVEVPKILGKQKFLYVSKRAKHGIALKMREKVELTMDVGDKRSGCIKSSRFKSTGTVKIIEDN
jgi:hypothetical protein